MAVTFGGDWDDIGSRYERMLHKAAETAMRQTIIEATRNAKNFNDRFKTGELESEINGDVFWESADIIVGQFGFTDKQELYYAIQTTLGRFYGSNFMEPSFALRDAAIIGMMDFVNKLSKAL